MTENQIEELKKDGIKFFEEGIDYPAQKADYGECECDDEVLLAARKAFGITYLYPWQRIVIENILSAQEEIPEDKMQIIEENNTAFYNGKQIVLLPTGAGKSLCFLTPALVLNGPTMVLYPLLALMSDQKRRMDEGGMISVVFKGGQTKEEREENFKLIREGAKIILANPEVLESEELLHRLSQCNIRHIAIDEAHCTSEWGDSFRPAYLNLGNVIRKINPKAVTAFTATASPEVLSRISEILFGGNVHIVRSESDRANIHYEVINTYAKKRTAFMLALSRPKPLIIFCGTRAKSEDMARELAAFLGTDKVKFYHAGLSREEKTKVETWFYGKTDGILAATCAYGMGVDKKDIHTVIHLEPSETAEAYIQEAGRGGRDGSIATAILLWSYEDSEKASVYEAGSRKRVLKTFAESTTCRRQILLDALGGEQAACDGCDICKRKKPADFARDAQIMINFAKRNKNRFKRNQFFSEMVTEFNRMYVKKIGMNVWEHSDIKEIFQQLFKQKKITVGKFPFKGLISPRKT